MQLSLVSSANELWPTERPDGMPNIVSLEVMCAKDHMDVHLTFSHPFEGIVSSKGNYFTIVLRNLYLTYFWLLFRSAQWSTMRVRSSFYRQDVLLFPHCLCSLRHKTRSERTVLWKYGCGAVWQRFAGSLGWG